MLTVYLCLTKAYNLILDISGAQSLDCLRVREGFNLGLLNNVRTVKTQGTLGDEENVFSIEMTMKL